MIIEALLNMIYSIFSVLSTPINVPDLPVEALEYVNTLFDYLVAGAGIVANFTPFDYLLILFGIILVIDVVIKLYHLIMWILKKIPFLGMS